MPLIHSTLPSVSSHVTRKPGDPARQQTVVLPVAPTHPQEPAVGNQEKAVTPAAPPSAVQLQIKAIITEQAMTIETAAEDAPDAQSK
jgi:hypothetical protein